MQTRTPSPLDKLLKPLQDFFRLESAGGLVLMVAAVLALAVANSPFAVYYAKLLEIPLVVKVGGFGVAKPLLLWINVLHPVPLGIVTGLLCGIGFTMSLFIASLAFEQGGHTAYLGLEQLGILLATLVSGLIGYVVLRVSLGNRTETT